MTMYTKKAPKNHVHENVHGFGGKYGIVWHCTTPTKNVNSSNYGIMARYGIVINHRYDCLSLRQSQRNEL